MARRTETIETLFAQNVKKFLVFASEHGQNKELLEKLYEKFSKTQPKRIELRNRNGNVTYCLVSAEHYEQLNQFKWRRSHGYVVKNSNDGTNSSMHRYILIDILKRVVAPNEVVDHLDRDPLNNTIENLDIATRIQNSENASKPENSSSKYYNVCKIERKSKITFKVEFKVNDELKLRAYYDIEIHAAHQYNLWFIKYKRKGGRINKIEIPSNFVEYIKIEKRDKDLPVGIWRLGKKFVIRPIINGTQISRSYYNSQEQAECELKRMLHEEKIRKLKMIFDTPILRKEGQCVIELFNKKNKKVGETIVDDREYYWLKRFPIWLSRKTVRIFVDGKFMILSRYIMKYDGDDYIDHIDRIPFNNTKNNLRIATPKQNSQNRTPLKKYIGVYPGKDGKKWVARIYVDGKDIHLGTFDNEIKAARARDVATKKYYGEFGSLNFPDTPRPRRRSI